MKALALKYEPAFQAVLRLSGGQGPPLTSLRMQQKTPVEGGSPGAFESLCVFMPAVDFPRVCRSCPVGF
jgi:hypothetical protein